MSFQLEALKPTSVDARLFHLTNDTWRPLVEFLRSQYPHYGPQMENWHYNWVDGLSPTACTQLAKELRHDLQAGSIHTICRSYNQQIDALEPQACKRCKGTGRDLPYREATQTCGSCEGVGVVRPEMSYYRIQPDLIENFTQFLEACGGFTIR